MVLLCGPQGPLFWLSFAGAFDGLADFLDVLAHACNGVAAGEDQGEGRQGE
jgi:hypothetical protein